mgnify:CR=1 FL=1
MAWLVMLCIASINQAEGASISTAATVTIDSGQQTQDRDTVAYTSKNPLVISATRSAKRLEDVSVPTTVLDAEMITRQGNGGWMDS